MFHSAFLSISVLFSDGVDMRLITPFVNYEPWISQLGAVGDCHAK